MMEDLKCSIMWLLKPPYKAIHALSCLWLSVQGGLWRRPPDCHLGTVHNALALAGYILHLGPNQPVVLGGRAVPKQVPNSCSAVFAVKYPKKSEELWMAFASSTPTKASILSFKALDLPGSKQFLIVERRVSFSEAIIPRGRKRGYTIRVGDQN